MKKFMVKATCAIAMAGSALLVPAVTGSSPADAATACTHNWVAVGWWNHTGTTQVAATNTCANMWSVKTEYWTDNVKGQFRNGAGAWTDSVQGWQKTTTSADAKKIILDLDDGEPLRAWVQAGPSQSVMLWY